MTAVIHLPHAFFYNTLLLTVVLVLLWALIYLIGVEVSQYLPVQLIAPSTS